jgi:hypothetical protein
VGDPNVTKDRKTDLLRLYWRATHFQVNGEGNGGFPVSSFGSRTGLR